MNLPVILRVFKGDHVVEVKQFQLDQIIIGNQAEVNLNLPDSSVSPIHALIEKRNETYFICDLGSAHGTFKGQDQILDEPLESGENIHIGPFRIQFMVGAPRPKTLAPEAQISNQGSSELVMPMTAVTVAPVMTAQSESSKSVSPAAVTSPQSNQPNLPQKPILDEAVVIAKTMTSEGVAVKKPLARPNLTGTFVSPSALPEENQVIKASKGSVIEISVGWRERIIANYHFRGNKAITIGQGDKADIVLPGGVFAPNHVIVDIQNGVASVNLRSDMKGDLLLEKETIPFAEIKQKGRLSSNTRGQDVVRLEQGEAMRISLVPGLINVYVRYVPSTQKPALIPFLPFTTGEVATVLLVMALVGLLALYNAIHAPIETPKEEIQPEIISVTKFEYPQTKLPPPEKVIPPTPPTPPPVKI